MSVPTTLLSVLAIGLFLFAWSRRDGSHIRGIKFSWQTLLRTTPMMIAAFLIGGYVSVLIPQNLIQELIGPDSGWRGLILAEVVGLMLPGGPYIVFPLIAFLVESGAGIGPAITMITSWANLALVNETFELAFMGLHFSAIRWGLSLIIPLIVGGAAYFLFGG